MRELGTPTYSKVFFQRILQEFPDESFICRVRHGKKTVAASFLTSYAESLEANWSSALQEHLQLLPNVFMYWNILCFAAERGFKRFDFGRSSRGSGTYNFKLEWNAREVPLHWSYWTANAMRAPAVNPENPRFALAVWAWKKMPLSWTKAV